MVLNLEATEWATVLCQRNLALKIDTKRREAVKVNLLASSDVNVFCRCVAGETVAVEDWNAIGIARCLVLCQYIFHKGRSVSATIGICELQRVRYRVVKEDI